MRSRELIGAPVSCISPWDLGETDGIRGVAMTEGQSFGNKGPVGNPPATSRSTTRATPRTTHTTVGIDLLQG